MQAAFLGLGIMGSRMARRLQQAGTGLRVWNRSPGKADGVKEAGATECESAADAVKDMPLVFTMLAHPRAVEDVALGEDGFLRHMKPGALWVDMSTGNPMFSRRLAQAAREADVRFMDAPVAGSRPQAEKGELVILAGGAQRDLDEVRPLLENLGNRIVHVGETGMGMSLKLVINHLLGSAMQAFAEGVTLGEALGIDRATLMNALIGGPVTAPFIAMKRDKMESGNYDTDFSLKWMHKDLHMVAEAAYEYGVAMPLSATVRESYRLARQRGLGEQDFAAIFHLLHEGSGDRRD